MLTAEDAGTPRRASGTRGPRRRSLGERRTRERRPRRRPPAPHIPGGPDPVPKSGRRRSLQRAPPPRRGRHAFGVERGDHDDRSEVVHDGERQQERLQTRRVRRAAKERTASTKTMSVGIAIPNPWRPHPQVDRQVDIAGRHHPPERGDHGHRGGPWIAEFPGHELPLDLQTHDQEEQGHRARRTPSSAGLRRPNSPIWTPTWVRQSARRSPAPADSPRRARWPPRRRAGGHRRLSV